MPPEAPRRIAFLGLGLIGGSIARAIRRADPTVELAAWSPSGRGPAVALRQAVIAEAAPDPEAALAGAQLVVLAGPAPTVLEHLEALAGPLRSALPDGATVTDVASTKATIVARAATLGLPFVGGHPMAGRDAAGYGAGEVDLFVGRPWVIDPAPFVDPLHRARVAWLARTCGAVELSLDAEVHDAAAAAISHLPLVAAAALVESVFGGAGERDGEAVAGAARALAGSGWRDTTRLARGDAAMGAGILATNARAVAARLRELRAALDPWIAALETDHPDAEAIEARLAAARALVDGPAGER